MAQTLETIRLLRIRAVVEGLADAARQENALAEAMKNVVKVSDQQATTTDRAANKVLAAGRAWDRYLIATDSVAKAISKADQAIRVISRAFDQLPVEEQKRRLGEFKVELEKVWQSLDKVGVPRNLDLTGNLGSVRRQAEENIKALERQREMEQRMARERDMMRQANPPVAHMDAFRQQQAMRAEEARVREMMRAANPPDLHVQMFRDRQQQIKVLADLELGMAAQVAAVDKKRLAERAALQTRINQLLQQALPIESQAIALAKEHKDADAALTASLINRKQHTAILADIERRRAIVLEAQQRHQMGNRLNRADMTNLGYQVNDIVTMLASGANPMQILATQGPQIVQILGSGDKGIAGSLRAMGAYMASLLTPARVLFGSLIAGAGAAALAWKGFDDSVKSLERSMMGMGRATRGSLGQLMGVTDQIAASSNLSRREARGVVGTFAGTGNIDPSLYMRAARAAEDYAAVTGTDIPDAASALAKALADPAQGIEDLDKQFNIFSETELKAARQMVAAGNIFGAQAKIIDGMSKSIGGATETLSGFNQMTRRIGDVLGTAWDMFGEDVAEVFGFQTLEEQLKKLDEARAKVQQNRDFVANDPDVREDRRAGQVARYDQKLADLERRAAEVRGNIQRLAGGGLQARADMMGKQILEMAKGWEPFAQRIKTVNDELEKMRRNLRSEEWGSMSEEARLRLHQGIGYGERMVGRDGKGGRLGLMRQYGGQEGYEDVLRSTFTAATTALTDYGRALAEIQFRREQEIETIRDSGPATAEQEARIRAVTQAREREIEALNKQTGMGLMGRYAPEVLERSNLANDVDNFTRLRAAMEAMGFSAAEIDEAMGRAQRALENFRTPFQQLVDEYERSVRQITAYTHEQQLLAAAEEALAEARRRNLNVTETAALVEMRQNELRLRNQMRQYESYRGARDEAGMVGMKPYQRQQQALTNEFNDRRLREGDSPYLQQEEALRRWAMQQEMLRGPLEQSNEELNEQIRLLGASASTFGMSAGAIEEAAERQRLLNEYMRQGIQITPELSAAIDAYAQRAGQFAQTRFIIREQQQAFEDMQDMGKDALKGFLSDLKEGKSLGEAFLGVMQRILDRLLDMMIDSLFDPNKGNPLMMLFSALGGNRGQGIGLPATRSTPFGGGLGMALPAAPQSLTGMPLLPPSAGSYSFNSAGYGGDPYSGVGSLVPTFKQATQAVSSLGAIAGSTGASVDKLGTFFTTAADGIKHQVETFVRQGAFDRGMDPDIVARGIKQESGFNPAALGDNGMSHGVMQLYTGGGLGNVARSRGISLAPSNWQEQVNFGLDVMRDKGHGAWYGFRDVGIRDPFAAHKSFNTRGLGNLSGGMGTDNLAQSVDQATASFNNLNPSLGQFQTGFQGISQSITQGVPQLQQNFNQLPSMIGQGGQQMGQAFQQTAGTVLQGGQGLGNAFSQIANSLGGMGGGGGGFGGLFSGLFGGGGGGFGGWGGFLETPIGGWGGFTFHTGGRVGGGGGSPRAINMADVIMSMYAPRMHTGGTVGGLRHDERRAILQTDEEVLSRRDAAEYRKNRGRSASGGDSKPIVNVNVHNNANAEVETRQNSDGSIDVLIERAEGRMAERASRGRGPLVKTMGREPNSLIG